MASNTLVGRMASFALGPPRQRWTGIASLSSLSQRSFLSPAPAKAQGVITDKDGKQYALIDMNAPRKKLKPYIVKRRLARMRTYEGKARDIRHSPWRLNLICQMVAGLPLTEALKQLDFCVKNKAPLVKNVLVNTANQANLKDGLQHSQLEVSECFATNGKHLKRLKIMGRGRSGVMHHRFSHMRVILREIDFKLKIYQAHTINQKKRWIQRQMVAEQDAARVAAEREEILELERQARAKLEESKSEK